MDLASPLRLAKRSICSTCLRQIRRTASTHFRFQTRNIGYIARPGEQASPISGYYADLSTSLPSTSHPAPRKRGSLPSAPKSTEQDEVAARARIVFGSRLAGPIARRADKDRKSTDVAGILIPPRPDEPDNCCMSGCVNCVWDVYREDLEEWAAKATEARALLAKQGKSQSGADAMRLNTSASKVKGGGMVTGPASMDDDGGGSETNWNLGSSSGDLFATIPVGIREFMRTEKALKERHLREAHAN